MIRVFLSLFVIAQISLANSQNLTISEANKTESNITEANKTQTSDQNLTGIIVDDLRKQILTLDSSIKDNVWYLQYKNYQTYQELIKNKISLESELKRIKKAEEKESINSELKVLNEQIYLLGEYEKSPFTSMIDPGELTQYEKIKSPVGIFYALSYIKQVIFERDEYRANLASLNALIEKLSEKKNLLKSVINYLPNDQKAAKEIGLIEDGLNELRAAKATGESTYQVYSTKLEDRIATVRGDIKVQTKRAINVGIVIGFIIVIYILMKFIAKKSIKDNERFYMTNKVINFINFFIIIFILLFAFIDNVSYFVTFLGFASAGLAIAMKDMFMSMLGWFVIVIGGTFRVGDRIRVRKINGETYVGDIIDISVLRMTIYEDVTMITAKEHRRAGRIIFVPNNYIFTELISNYTHSGMKTVWDGIDITLTFDSNYQKATYIIKNIARQYSKGYTDIAKKQMNKLRSQYSIKSPSVEPRIFHFFDPYGIKISVWYMTNSYATLALRSTISGEILEALRKESDIKIAYPSQTLYVRDKDNLTSIESILDIQKENTTTKE